MAREVHAAIGDYTLRKRRRDHGRKLTVHAAVGCSAQPVEQDIRIGWVRLARGNLHGKWHIDDAQALVKKSLVADDNDIAGIRAVKQRVAQLRTDASGLAGCNYEWLIEHQT